MPRIDYHALTLFLADQREGSKVVVEDGPYGPAEARAGSIIGSGMGAEIPENWLQVLETAVRSTGPPSPEAPANSEATERHGKPQPRSEGMPALPTAIGRALHEWLFPHGAVRDCAMQCSSLINLAPQQGLCLHLTFPLSPAETLPRIAAWPWELIHPAWLLASAVGHPAPDRRFPVVRGLKKAGLRLPPIPDPPLRLLITAACPKDQPQLNLMAELAEIDLAARQAGARTEILEHAKLEATREALLDFRPHVLHFLGHGDFEDGRGQLVFENADRDAHPVAAETLAPFLRDADLRLVLLNACDGARLPREEDIDPYSSVAAALIAAGLPAVLAMQFPISDEAAIAFSRAFYRSLTAGDPLEGATEEGRLGILGKRPSSWEWVTPVLYLQSRNGSLLPPMAEDRDRTQLGARIHDLGDWLESLTESFVGRDFLFQKIREFTLQEDRGYLHVVGEPGIGKSTLAAHLVRKHGYPHHFNFRANRDSNRAEHFLENLCAQLILRYRLPYSNLPPEATQGPRFLQELLRQISERLEKGDKALIVVDALDEVRGYEPALGGNLLDLPMHLPQGIFFLLTGRPEEDLLLTVRVPLRPVLIDPKSAENRHDIESYIARFLPREGIQNYRQRHKLSEAEFVHRLAEASEGNFMYLHHVLPEIGERYQSLDLRELPRGLKEYYKEHWASMKGRMGEEWYQLEVPVLAALTQLETPVSAQLLARILDRSDIPRIQTVLDRWRQFFRVTRRETEAGQLTQYRLYHQSFHDFIKRQDQVAGERIRLEETSRQIAERFEALRNPNRQG